jgi:hypothetical protein
LGDFINPLLPPRTDCPIHLALDEALAQVLTKRRPGEVGAAHIGSPLSREKDRVPVTLLSSSPLSALACMLSNSYDLSLRKPFAAYNHREDVCILRNFKLGDHVLQIMALVDVIQGIKRLIPWT